MKKLFLPLILFIVTSIVNAAPAKTPSYTLTKNNPVLTFQLPSNPTTGYSWFLTSYDKNLLTLIKHQYFSKSTCENHGKSPVGIGGYEVWQFKATKTALKAPQITYIKLIYVRPWTIKTNSLPKDIKSTTIYAVIKP